MTAIKNYEERLFFKPGVLIGTAFNVFRGLKNNSIYWRFHKISWPLVAHEHKNRLLFKRNDCSLVL